ncbi:MAG: hypothetical protein EHM64_10830 [Ignavibacteriae bacterium]|nr:MAG: hypothetical protein EHM64_10830 [Ignavibacteriota bacterium]
MQSSLDHYKALLVIFLSLLCTIPLSLSAQEISIEDFRIPETKYQRFLGGLTGRWNASNYESISNSIGNSNKYSNSDNSADGQMWLNYITNRFNEDYSFQLGLSADGFALKSKSDYNQANVIPVNFSNNSRNEYGFIFRPNANYSKYIIPDAWYWYVQGSGNYSYLENRQVNNNSNTSYDSSYNKNNNWSASLGLGVGYGKMRDGYSVFGVLRLLDKLEEDSLLVRPLTKEEILRLVSIFSRRAEYAASQERYVKYFMDDLFEELQKMGVIKNSVPLPYSVARAVEVLSEQIEPRLFGWRVQLGYQKTFDEINAYSDHNNSISHSPYYYWDSRDFIKLSSEFGHALSLNLHLYSSLSVDIPTEDYNRKVNFNFTVNGIYQLGERIDASLLYIFGRTHYVSNVDQDNFSRSLNSEIRASFRFFIENNVSFTLSGGYRKYDEDSYSRYGTSNNTRTYPQISFGVNYRFF